MKSRRFTVSVIGQITVSVPGLSTRRLSPANRHFLALLVAAGPAGIKTVDLARERDDDLPLSDSAIRMAAARLRKHLGEELVPRADDGVYRLNAARDAVDVWHLESTASRPLEDLTEDEVLALAHPEPAYRGVPIGEFLEASERHISRLQRDLLVRWIDSHPRASSSHRAEVLVGHAHADLLNEVLLHRAATALAASGRRDDAIRLIGSAQRAFIDAGLTLGADALALEAELLMGAALPPAVASKQPVAAPKPVPNQLHAQIVGHYVGGQRELQAVTARVDSPVDGLTAVVVSGQSGIGKTRLCAEAAEYAANRGWHVMMLRPSTFGNETPFGPLVAALPELGHAVTRFVAGNSDPDSDRVTMWTAVRGAIESHRKNAPLLLVVDDAQWIDEATAEFLAHYATGTVPGHALLLTNGRRDPSESAHWASLQRQLAAVGAISLEVGPLDLTSMADFVADLRPGMNGTLHAAVTNEIFERSGGLPGVARPLLAAVPEGSAVVPATSCVDDRLAVMPAIEQLSELARVVGIASAVLGARFRFDALQAVTELPGEALLAGLDELLDRALVLDQSIVDYELAHVLIEGAFLAAATTSELAHAHARAADFHRTDVQRSAHHISSSLPLSSTNDAVAALTIAAEANVSDRSYRNAIRQFSLIETLRPGALNAPQLGRYARALDLSGMHGEASQRRREGTTLAEADRDWSTVLDVASSGFPETYAVEGNKDLADLLERIDPTELVQPAAFRHATLSSRQLIQNGQVTASEAAADRALHLAAGPSERVEAAIVRRVVMNGRTNPRDRIAVLRTVAAEINNVDQGLRGDYRLNLALDLYASGNIAEALVLVDELTPASGCSIVKVWQGQLLRATHAFDAGDTARGRALRINAHAFATNAGLGGADTALLASMLIEAWRAGDADSFLDQVDGGLLDPSRGLVAQAGASAVLHAAGQQEQAIELAIKAARHVLDAPMAHTLETLAMVSAPLAIGADGELLERVRSAFRAVGSSTILVGAGAANLGAAPDFLAALE